VTGRLVRGSVAGALLVVAGLASLTASRADPGDDEITRVLAPKPDDSPAVKHFKETGKNPYNDDPEAIAAGFKLARAVACTHCHGGDLSGLIGPNLTLGNWRYLRDGTDKGLFQTLYFGTAGGMAAWGKLGSLTDDEILRVMAFIRSRYKGDPKDITWE
jgi:cytochrome c-L